MNKFNQVFNKIVKEDTQYADYPEPSAESSTITIGIPEIDTADGVLIKGDQVVPSKLWKADSWMLRVKIVSGEMAGEETDIDLDYLLNPTPYTQR